MSPRSSCNPATRVVIVVALIALSAVAVMLRVSGLNWLIGLGPWPNFSFHPDDLRFVLTAMDFENGSSDGYVTGMATHLFLLKQVMMTLGFEFDLSTLLRAVTLAYAAVTIPVTYLLARAVGSDWKVALVAAAFVAVTPLHAVSSHFGTADVTVIVWFYASLLLGGAYLRTGNQWIFIAFAAACGVTVGIKFFVPIAVPLVVVALLDPRRDWRQLVPLGLLAGYAGFAAATFFNFNPWDLYRLLRVLRNDNLTQGGGLNPFEQVREYSMELFTAFGVVLAIVVIIGTAYYLARYVGAIRREVSESGLKCGIVSSLATQRGLIAASLITHAALILYAEVHGPRHTLVFVPIACVFAAGILFRAVEMARLPRPAAALLVVGVIAYQVPQVWALDKLYTADPRALMSEWVNTMRNSGQEVYTTSWYTWFRNAKLEDGGYDLVAREAQNYVTCDLEFGRYFETDDATDVVHGGEKEMQFFRQLFSGRLPFRIEREFVVPPLGMEQRLIQSKRLRSVGTYIPQQCYAFVRVPEGIAVDPNAFPAPSMLASGSW